MSSIGRLRHRLVIQAPAETADGAGGVSRSWRPIAHVWGSVESAVRTRGERDRADRPEIATAYRITIRWRPGITGALRFADGDRAFAIKGVADPDGSRRWLVITAEEVIP